MAATSAASSEGRASVAKEVALNALRNALAVSDEKAQELLAALHDGNTSRIRTAEESWEQAVSDAEEALDVAEEINKHLAQSVLENAAARQQATRASKSGSAHESESAAAKAERHAKYAEKFAKKAQSLAEELKKKWLVPPPPVPAPSPAVSP